MRSVGAEEDSTAGERGGDVMKERNRGNIPPPSLAFFRSLHKLLLQTCDAQRRGIFVTPDQVLCCGGPAN